MLPLSIVKMRMSLRCGLALMRRDGTIEVNPELPNNRRISNALAVVKPALDELVARRADFMARGIEVDL